MSFIQVFLTPRGSSSRHDITSFVTELGNYSEFSDDTNFFSGIFRRGNMSLTLDNNAGTFDRGGLAFGQSLRENSILEFFYRANDPSLNPYLIFKGLVNEGSSENDLRSRQLNLLIVDQMKFIDSVGFFKDDALAVDALYKNLRNTEDIQLNKDYTACFLWYIFFRKSVQKLNPIFNVFSGSTLQLGSYPSINATIESIFPASDDFYSENQKSALSVLNELVRSMNSYSILETDLLNNNQIKLHIKGRPTLAQGVKKVLTEKDIIGIDQQTEGFNKLYNSITINGLANYEDLSSISKYGVRILNVQSYAPPSQALADSFLSLYAQPKTELNIMLPFSHENLDHRIGDKLQLDVKDVKDNLTVRPINKVLYVLSRDLDFNAEIINLRMREV